MVTKNDPTGSPGGAISLFITAVNRFERALLVFCTMLLIVVVLFSVVEIIARTFFKASSIEAVDLSLQLSVLMYFLGYAVLLNRGEDIEVDYFHRRFPPRLRRGVDVLTCLAVVLFFVIVLWKSIALFRLGMRFTHPVFPIPNAVVILPALLGSAACLLIAVKRTFEILLRERPGPGTS